MTSPQSPAAAVSTGVVVHVFGRTDVGRTREHNEDCFAVADLTTGVAELTPEVRTHVSGARGSLFVVADGMGGAAAGEIASSMAVDTVVDALRARWSDTVEPPSAEAFAAALRAAVEEANTRIHQFAAAHPEYRGMGTTATVAGLLGDRLFLAQIGDSRAYLVRGGTAWQLTKDQSLMQKLVEAGEITAEEAEQSDRRNIILQALGPEPTVKTDVTHQAVRRGDRLLLCSDGLSGLVRPEDIVRVLDGESDLARACDTLIDLANSRGGPDNITVVAARFEGEVLTEPRDGDEVGHRAFPLEGDAGPSTPLRRLSRRSLGIPAQRDPQRADGDGAAPDAPFALPALVGIAALLLLIVVAFLVRRFL